MKETISNFIDRLRNAWSIIKGHNQVLVRYDEDTSMQDAYCTLCALMGARWLINSNNVDFNSRFGMLDDLLDDTNSIMMLTKDADGTLTYCYDCKSEEDFDDLISMEVK
nr:MAG TPA: hypothetical protein [Caudoviricetes sp.]